MIESSELPLIVPGNLNPPLTPTLVTDGAGLEKVKGFLQRTEANGLFGLDFETNIPHYKDDFYDRRLRTIQVGDRNEQYVVDLLAFAETKERLIEGQGNYKPATYFQPIVDVFEPFLNTNKILKVGANLAFEYITAKWCLGIRLWHLYSVDIAEKILYAGLVHFKTKGFWGLDDMVARYMKVQVDKSLQKSFDLETPLTEDQVIYAALDTRLPLPIRLFQLKRLQDEGLMATNQIEQDSIGAFADIHMNGVRVSKPLWTQRVKDNEEKHKKNLALLDSFFIPVVGRKGVPPFDLNALENAWRDLGVDNAEVASIKANIKGTKDKLVKEGLKQILSEAVERQRQQKAAAKDAFYKARKEVSEAMKALPKCEGEARINYDSNPQLLAALQQMKGLKRIDDTSDETLESLAPKHPVIAALRDFRTTQKALSTYGMQWTTSWQNKPCVEEGWEHPKTGRIHSVIGQLNAETGRTSSVKPNLQNLEQEDEVRAAFIADEPDPNIRISVCCDADTSDVGIQGEPHYICDKCLTHCDTKPEEYCIVTCDMSGAELRIIADYGQVKTWIDAFNKGWDVHSVSTEILYFDEWASETCKGGEKYFDKEAGKEIELPPCAYFAKDHKKCKCPGHNKRRNDTKATNFLLCYGGGPRALAQGIKKTETEARELMVLHEQKFPDVWGYLKRAGQEAVQKLEARTMFGRRRLFRTPNWENAKIEAKARLLDKDIDDREPTTQEINRALAGMYGSIERRGKNHGIQGTNADIIKRAMGCGFDKDGKPYLWHILEPEYKAKLINMVHDELVVQCPKRYGHKVLEEIGDAYRRAAAEVMKHVRMGYEGHVDTRWRK
jgi:DNA polymerase I-like protein with 3'-5' exonuclease and polymerase domains